MLIGGNRKEGLTFHHADGRLYRESSEAGAAAISMHAVLALMDEGVCEADARDVVRDMLDEQPGMTAAQLLLEGKRRLRARRHDRVGEAEVDYQKLRPNEIETVW